MPDRPPAREPGRRRAASSGRLRNRGRAPTRGPARGPDEFQVSENRRHFRTPVRGNGRPFMLRCMQSLIRSAKLWILPKPGAEGGISSARRRPKAARYRLVPDVEMAALAIEPVAGEAACSGSGASGPSSAEVWAIKSRPKRTWRPDALSGRASGSGTCQGDDASGCGDVADGLRVQRRLLGAAAMTTEQHSEDMPSEAANCVAPAE